MNDIGFVMIILLYAILLIVYIMMGYYGVKAYMIENNKADYFNFKQYFFLFLNNPSFMFEWKIIIRYYPIFIRPNSSASLLAKKYLTKRNRFIWIFWVIVTLILLLVFFRPIN